MPLRHELKKILIIGSGPIVIGQGPEFDYSGVQACKALRSIGCEVVLVNPNPATIMTDPQIANRTYIESISSCNLEKILAKERPDALLSTLGGQTALNCALELDEKGILEKYNVELIGANKQAIIKAEDRNEFRQVIRSLGLESARSYIVEDLESAIDVQQELGFPVIIRPSYTLGGSGGGIAWNCEDFERICKHGLDLSINSQILIEEYLTGWKEYELEVIRDNKDNCIVVCSIENVDPMGIHTGDSITVAPSQTLTDKEYQRMRNAAFAILRAVNVETGGANVQFAINPVNGRMIVVEMNPRVSRSSALASKATGYPIAKVATLLSVGYALDEISNALTGSAIPASFEPSLDYVVVKIPRFNFDKMPGVDNRLTSQMHAVGEVMAVGSSFSAAMQKALCSLETGLSGFDQMLNLDDSRAILILEKELKFPGPHRILYVAEAFRAKFTLEEVHAMTGIDLWFLDQIHRVVFVEKTIKSRSINKIERLDLLEWKKFGFSDARIAKLLACTLDEIFSLRQRLEVSPVYRHIDSCSAEFPVNASYLYSTYTGVCEIKNEKQLNKNGKKIIVIGSGPNRIGQGVEFDYCCVHAVQSIKKLGFESIMINCNPETVSTDYDMVDKLYFEPITLEYVINVIKLERPYGVIVQFGGQTPLKLVHALEKYNVKILGTSIESIDTAEDRNKFTDVVKKIGLLQPRHELIHSQEQCIAISNELSLPLIIRPSYVLGGRAMKVVRNIQELKEYASAAFEETDTESLLVDEFLQDAVEVDVDVLADMHGQAIVTGILEHIEPAGVHSGDSVMTLPPYKLSLSIQQEICDQAVSIAKELKIVGLMNIQFAIQSNKIYVLEVNPRASRTVPFVAKATQIPIIDLAVRAMLGYKLDSYNFHDKTKCYYAVKRPIFPFAKFFNVDPMLGPEMKSTGEGMSLGRTFNEAYKKAVNLNILVSSMPRCVYLSVNEGEKEIAINIARKLNKLGVSISACSTTTKLLDSKGIDCTPCSESGCVMSMLDSGTIALVVCTKEDSKSGKVRSLAIQRGIEVFTNIYTFIHYIDSIKTDTEVYCMQNLTMASEELYSTA